MSFWTFFNENDDLIGIDDFLKPYIIYNHQRQPLINRSTPLPPIDDLLEIENLSIDIKMKNKLLLTFVTEYSILHQLLIRALKSPVETDLAVIDKLSVLCNDSNNIDENDTICSKTSTVNGENPKCRSFSENERLNNLCFEIVSCDDPIMKKCLLEDHLETILEVLDAGELNTQYTARLCRLFISLVNYNQQFLCDQLNKYDFHRILCKHMENSSLLECIAQSKFINTMGICFSQKLINTIVDHWTGDIPISYSSLELLIQSTTLLTSSSSLSSALTTADNSLLRIIDQIFIRASDKTRLFREACLHCLLKICDNCLPWPFLPVDTHIIEKQMDEELRADQNEQNGLRKAQVKNILLIFNETNRDIILKEISYDDNEKAFTRFRYLWLCLFMRLLGLATTRFKDVFLQVHTDDINSWLQKILKDCIIPNILVRWPTHHIAHDLVIKLAEMSIHTNLFSGEERLDIARTCLEQWFKFDEENLVQQYCSWSHWSMLIRILCPASMLNDSNNAMAKLFLWNEHINLEKKKRYDNMAPVNFQLLANQIMFTPRGCGWYYEEDDDISINDNSLTDQSIDSIYDDCIQSHTQQSNCGTDNNRDSNAFDNLWWCSPEDVITDLPSDASNQSDDSGDSNDNS